MTAERRGVLAGGNWIVDQVKTIDHYPEQDGLALVLEQCSGNGGSPYNVLKDLSKLEAPFPLAGVGIVGEDQPGDFILADCRAAGIDTTHIRRTAADATSYTDVMTVQSSGRRTFFHRPGASRLLDGGDFPLATSRARILHLGYMLLLETLDVQGADGRTGAACLLEEARARGFRTSADMVSEDSARVARVVNAALPGTDYFFLNDFEAERITGITTRSGGGADWEQLARAARVLIGRGVHEVVCIHCTEGAVAATSSGEERRQGSVALPDDRIAGAVGAGDAFAAGALLGLHEGWTLAECLRLGVCAAAACITHPTSSAGVLPWRECLRLGESLGFRA